MYDPTEYESQNSPPPTQNNSTSKPPTRLNRESKRKCAYCGNPFLPSESKHLPFCSSRCQQVDLGMWLTESYGLPYEGEAEAPPEPFDDDQ